MWSEDAWLKAHAGEGVKVNDDNDEEETDSGKKTADNEVNEVGSVILF